MQRQRLLQAFAKRGGRLPARLLQFGVEAEKSLLCGLVGRLMRGDFCVIRPLKLLSPLRLVRLWKIAHYILAPRATGTVALERTGQTPHRGPSEAPFAPSATQKMPLSKVKPRSIRPRSISLIGRAFSVVACVKSSTFL